MEVINEKYRVENIKLGSGGFSDVFLGTNLQTNQQVAIKKVSLTQKSLQEEHVLRKLKTEIELMQSLDHPNIVKYYDVDKKPTYWYIVMEYCNMGTLDDVINFNELMIKKKELHFNREANTYYYLNQLKDALNHLRRKGCIHRDIKPMNILLTKQISQNSSFMDSGIIFKSDEQMANSIDKTKLDCSEKIIVKLADFGLAKSYMDSEESLMDTICGSPLYMAPELIIDRAYNSKADLWSFGIIMYQLLFGSHPQGASSFQQLVKNLKVQSIDFHLNKNFTPHCFDLVTKLLIKDPHKRIDWIELINHKWFLHWKNINNGEEDAVFVGKIHNYNDLSNTNHKPAECIISESITNNKDMLIPNRNLFTKPPSKPIQIANKSTINGFPEKISPKFSAQIGSPSSPHSPLGPSNLSRMKIDNNHLKNYTQGTYVDYPASYPIETKRTLATSTTRTIPGSRSVSFQNSLSGRSLGQSQSWDHYAISNPGTSTSRSRIFQNNNIIRRHTDSVDITKTNKHMTIATSPLTDSLTNSNCQTTFNTVDKLDMSDFVITDYRSDNRIKTPISLSHIASQTPSATSFSNSPVIYVEED